MGNLKTMAFFEYVNNYTTHVCLDGIDRGIYFASFYSEDPSLKLLGQ